MTEAEHRWAGLLQTLALEVGMAKTDAEFRHFVRQLEFACHTLRTTQWAEASDIGAAISLAAGETP